MPKTAADLIEPIGELSKGLFPQDKTDAEFEGRLQSYLNTAYTKLTAAGIAIVADRDEAAVAYAYYRAYDAIWLRLSSTPISVALTDQGSRTYSRDQIAAFKGLADQWLGEWHRFIPDLSPPSEFPHSAPAKTIFGW